MHASCIHGRGRRRRPAWNVELLLEGDPVRAGVLLVLREEGSPGGGADLRVADVDVLRWFDGEADDGEAEFGKAIPFGGAAMAPASIVTEARSAGERREDIARAAGSSGGRDRGRLS